MGSRTTVYDFVYAPDSDAWTLQTSDGDTVLKQEKKATAWYPDRTGRETTRAITGADGSSVIQNIETIQTFSWGDGVTRRITDPAGACLTNTFAYTAAGLTESAVEPDAGL
jgi:hypothetical protein